MAKHKGPVGRGSKSIVLILSVLLVTYGISGTATVSALGPITETVKETTSPVTETVKETTETVTETVTETTETVTETTETVTEPVTETTETVTEPVEETVEETTETVTETVEETTTPVTETVEETVKTVEEPKTETTETVKESTTTVAEKSESSESTTQTTTRVQTPRQVITTVSIDQKIFNDKDKVIKRIELKEKTVEKQFEESKKNLLDTEIDPLEKHKKLLELESKLSTEIQNLKQQAKEVEERTALLQSEIVNKVETKVDKKVTRIVNSIDPLAAAKNLGLEFKDGKVTLVVELADLSDSAINNLKSLGKIEVQSDTYVQISTDLSNVEMLKTIPGVKNTRAPTYISMSASSQLGGPESPFAKTSVVSQIDFKDKNMQSLMSQLGVDTKTLANNDPKIETKNATSPLTAKLFELIDTVSEKNLRSFMELLTKYGKVIQLRADLGEKELNSISNLEGLLEFPTSEGTYTISADVVHDIGITGKGVKVAVLDLSFDTSNPKISQNIKEYESLRKGVQGNLVQQDKSARIQAHGTAVAEVIADVAPGVELYLYEMDTDVEFIAAVDKAIAQKVDVIAMAAGWPNLPTDGTSHITKKVEEATSKGISFVVPSGNFAKKHWEGGFSDSNLNGWHEFVTNDEGLGITVTSTQVKNHVPIIVYMTWDTGLKDIADFDLALIDPSGAVAEYSSTAQNTKDSSFSEYIYFVPQSAGTYLIGINYAGVIKSPADVPRYAQVELFSINNQVEHFVVPSSVVVPADAKGVTSVGAINHMTGKIESFSSQGPTNHAKQAPFMVGPDGVTTLAYNGDLFYGTSATTPYIAGVTALIKQMNPDASPQQIQEMLKKNAELTSGVTSKDNLNSIGFGTVNLALLASG